MSVSLFISKRKYSDSIKKIEKIKEELASIRRSKVSLDVLLLSQSNPNFLIGYPMYLVNLFAPIDMLLYSLFSSDIRNNIKPMRLCLEVVGEIDASIAI